MTRYQARPTRRYWIMFYDPLRRTLPLAKMLTLALVAALCLTNGCSKTRTVKARPNSPAPVYTGPAYLRGTVGSMARLNSFRPVLVSGYGLVVNLRGTGSPDVPASLREWLINEMRKRGVGSTQHGGEQLNPGSLLSSPNTAVVLVEGVIPPGAVAGTSFDVLVNALPQTQTTSLQGGQLWTVDLSLRGGDGTARFSRMLAQSNGPLYLNPFGTEDAPDAGPSAIQRTAVVLSGGTVTDDQPIELTLNQPSWQRSRAIADRINERFPRGNTDRHETAVPVNDTLIRLHIPARFAGRTEQLLTLIGFLYVQRAPGFEPAQAARLTEIARDAPTLAAEISWVWQALGKTALPAIRRQYRAPQLTVALAALKAGAGLADETAVEPLADLATHKDPAVRAEVADILARLPSSIRGARQLYALLQDPDQSVRVQAYEALADIGDPAIRSHPVGSPSRLKFLLDLVPSDRPLVYVTQTKTPSLVIFNPSLSLNAPFVARFWDNHLMLRADAPGDPVRVYYQAPGQNTPTEYEIVPTAAALAAFLAHKPSTAAPADGLDLSYSQVAEVFHRLCRDGHLPAEMHLMLSPLAESIRTAGDSDITQPRPETSPQPPSTPTAPPRPDTAATGG